MARKPFYSRDRNELGTDGPVHRRASDMEECAEPLCLLSVLADEYHVACLEHR